MRSSFKTLLATTLLSAAALGAAHASVTIPFNSFVGPSGTATIDAQSAAGATSSPFALGYFGNNGTNGLVSTAPVSLSDGGSVTFAPNSSIPQAGVYSGSTPNVATSPFSGTNLTPSNYLVAQPNDNVSITFGTRPGLFGIPIANTLTSFDLLWGTVDTFNSLNLDFYALGTLLGNATISGSEVATAAGISPNGTTPAFVEINLSGLAGFDRVVATSTQSAFEFDPSVSVPEPASVALLGAGLLGFGLTMRRRSKTA